MAKYLLCININGNRKALSRLRLSNHKLLVEKGRWKSIPRHDRKCTICDDLEDEYHAILICPKFITQRNKYIKSYYTVKPSMHKFVQLLNTENIKEQQRLAICTKLILIQYNEELLN